MRSGVHTVALVMALFVSGLALFMAGFVIAMEARSAIATPNPGHGSAPGQTWCYAEGSPADPGVCRLQTTTTFWRLWFGPSAAPGKIQIDDLTHLMASEGASKTTQAAVSGETMLHGSGWASDVGRAYFSTLTGPYKLIRVDPDDLNGYTVYSAPWCASAYALAIDGGKVYVGCSYGEYLYINEFSTGSSPPTLITSHSLGNAYGLQVESLATDGTYLYIGTDGRWVLKKRLSDWQTVASRRLTDLGEDSIHGMAYDAEYDYIFCTTGPGAHYIYRLDASDLGNEIYQQLPGASTDDMAVVPGHVYVGFEATQMYGGTVCKLSKTDLSDYDLIRAGPDEFSYGVFAAPSGDHVWAAFKGTPGTIARIRVSDDSARRIWLADDEIGASEVVFCGDSEDKVLVTTWPAFKMVRLDDVIVDEPCRRSDTSTCRSYWWPIRLYSEDSPGGTIDTLEAHTDGTNSLGGGIDLKGNTATSYVQPTGTAGTGGDELSTASYSSLAGAVQDIFGWTEASPKSIAGSGSSQGDIGDFLVLQLVFGSAASDGRTGEEVLTFTHEEDGWPRQSQGTFYGLLNAGESAPVGGAAESPDAAGEADGSGPWMGQGALLAALAVVTAGVLGVGAWYARRRFSQRLIRLWRRLR